MRFSTTFVVFLALHLIHVAAGGLKSSSSPLLDISDSNDDYTNVILTRIQQGFHPNAIDFHNDLSPICYAAHTNNLPLLTMLINHGATLDDDRCSNNWTPLMFASYKGLSSLSLVEYLLARGADPYHVSSDAYSPYHLATDETIKQLLEKSILTTPKYQKFLTNKGHISLLLPIASLKSKDTLHRLLFPTDSSSSPASSSKSAFFVPPHRMNQLNEDLDINERSLTLQTPLMLAAQSGQYQNIKLLLSVSAEINLQDSNGWTALMFATESNCLLCIDALLNANALASIKSNSGQSVISIASTSLASNILHISLCKAITTRNSNEILNLITLGADVNTQCDYNMNYTPLIIAVKLSQVDLVELLLTKYHANPNLTDSHQWSPLMFATVQKSTESYEIMKLLITSGSDLYQRNRDGMTATQIADFIHNEKPYRYLLSQHHSR